MSNALVSGGFHDAGRAKESFRGRVVGGETENVEIIRGDETRHRLTHEGDLALTGPAFAEMFGDPLGYQAFLRGESSANTYIRRLRAFRWFPVIQSYQ